MSKRATPRRDLLLATAARLFNAEGFRKTGIDLILAESGVSKATLYKHFRSKEALILAVLEWRHQTFSDVLISAADQALLEVEPQQNDSVLVVTLFEQLAQWFGSEDFNGCYFIRACLEYGLSDEQIRDCSVAHKLSLQNYMEQHLLQVAVENKAALAQQLLVLMDGAIVHAQMGVHTDAAEAAKHAALALLTSYRER